MSRGGLGLCCRTPGAPGGRGPCTKGAVSRGPARSRNGAGRRLTGQGARSDAGPRALAIRFPAGGLEERGVFLSGRSLSAAGGEPSRCQHVVFPVNHQGTTEASPLAREASSGPCGVRRLLPAGQVCSGLEEGRQGPGGRQTGGQPSLSPAGRLRALDAQGWGVEQGPKLAGTFLFCLLSVTILLSS